MFFGDIKMFKKADIAVFAAVAAVAFAGFLILPHAKEGKTVVIKKNNETVFTGSLYKDTEVDLVTNLVVIKNGTVNVVWASCKNQICVKHKSISKSGESIICLPNAVIAQIK